MSMIESVLVLLDGSERSAASLGCVAWLAQRTGAQVHVLSAESPQLPVREELERLRVPEAYWSSVTLHMTGQAPELAVPDAVRDLGIQLIAMTARGAAAEASAADDDPWRELGHVSRWVVEHSTVPVLMMPPSYQERLPWTTAVIPVSGEAEADEVLGLGVRLCNDLGLKAIAVHVLAVEGGPTGLAAETRYADAAHHEYPCRLQELVRRGLPGCTPTEAGCIADVLLGRGDVAEELLALVRDRHADLLILGWHGTFLAGHANVIRTLLREATCPILLVKTAPRAPFKLKVGEELE